MERFDIGRGVVSVERIGDGPDLVVLHSLLTDRHAFDTVVPPLARSWRVNLVDLPGFGDSSVVEASIDAQADVVGALLAEGGFDPATTAILGNGWGAFVGLGTAVRHGSRFDKLVLVGCGSGFPPAAKTAFAKMIEQVEAGGMDAVVGTAVARIFPADYLLAHPQVAEDRAAVLLRTRPPAFVAACRALIEVDYDEAIKAIANPTLVVVGGLDEATPPALARRLAAAIPDASLIEMEGVGHAPQLQSPDRFIGVVAEFLELAEAGTRQGERR